MIVTCVYVSVKPERINEFILATTENHMASVREQGNFRFDFGQQADDSSRFIIYEAYDSDDTAAKHKQTPHYLKWRDTVADMMAEPRKGVKYNILKPSSL
jgi:autoinducer 2-degrading protein